MKNILGILILACVMTVPAIASPEPALRTEMNVHTDAPGITVNQGSITLTPSASDAEFNFFIYSITGQLVKRARVTDSAITVELPTGCYIVKCERWSKKIIVN